ncbi:chromosome segregation protein SMC [bacterium]|nr:chromosome segregation protein SMC [bacterium]
MYIKKLEVDNFKSFANKVDIPLLKGFTTITGPNGSGKSTIIDSILFALGLSSSRSLRAEKLEHFISTHTKRNEAIVKVTFGEVGDDNMDFSVTRKIKKSSQGYNSIYYLNDKATTLTEIHSLLEKYNVTPNSYNVMMQGDVTSITNCSQVERRKIIDEIAGVADFDRRIEQAKSELETVEERVEKSSLILQEVDAQLEQLKEEREVALKYQKLKDEKTNLEGQITTVKFFDFKRMLEQAHANILEFTKKKKEEEASQKDLEEKLKLVKIEHEKISEKVKENGENQQIELKKKLEGIKGDIDRKQSAITYADKQIQDGLKSVENMKNGIEKQTRLNEDYRLKIKLKKDEILKTQEKLDEEKNKRKRVLEEMTGLNKSADEHIKRRTELRKQIEDLTDKENNLIREKIPLESELETLKKELNQANEKIKESQDFELTFKEERDRYALQVDELQKEIDDLKSAQQRALQDLDTVKTEIADNDFNLQATYRKLTNLEVQKQAAEDANFGRAVDTVMTSGLKGVHAPLAKLGTVDKEYSTALEVAIGGRMAHIVVDDDHTGAVAIELLKSSNAGRATFIPLNKIAPCPKKLSLPKDDGVIDFAINLIDFDDIYIDAFYYAVGDTVVVEDLACARKLMGKYRIVTLAGELIEKSGSMTGGTLKRTGLKFAQNDDEELERVKVALKKFEEEKKNLSSKRYDIEDRLDKIRTQYSNSITEHSRAKLELSNLDNKAKNNAVVIAEKQEIVNNNTAKISEINKQLDKAEEKHFDISEKLTVLNDEIAKVDALINDDVLKELEEKTKVLDAEIKRLEKIIADIENEINVLEKNIEFGENTVINSHKENISNILSNNETLKQDKERFAKEIKELDVRYKELEEEIDKINEKLGELLKQRDEIKSRMDDIETKKHLKASDIEKVTEQIESFKARRRELEPQFEDAKSELEKTGIEVSKLEPVQMSIEEINNKISRLDKRMEDLGLVNMRALTDYDNKLARQNELKSQIETLSAERVQILDRMQGYEQLKKETFLTTYNDINTNFKDIFHKLSDGEGTLILENEEDPLSGGLTIEAQPRDKRKQRLEGLSGGEKSLTAIAFVLAIQRHMPAPFYAFDEVDMHLDGINIEKLSEMIKYQAKNTQFIVVSLRKPMFESSDRMIGVTQKDKGVTQVTGIPIER